MAETIHGDGAIRRPVNLVGIDVVKVAPAYDQSEITALAAAHVAADLLCVMRNRELRKRRT